MTKKVISFGAGNQVEAIAASKMNSKFRMDAMREPSYWELAPEVRKIAKDAKQKRPGTGDDGVMIINVLWNPLNNVGSIDVDGKPFAVAPDITPIVQAMVQKTPDCRILLRADKDVKYDYLRSVLKAAGAGGVTNITFSVVDKE